MAESKCWSLDLMVTGHGQTGRSQAILGGHLSILDQPLLWVHSTASYFLARKVLSGRTKWTGVLVK